MDTYASLIASSGNAWSVAESALAKLKTVDTNDTAAYSKALMEAQLQVSIATSVEQKASSTIDKAFQAHSQVASK
jgi:cellobiose-specific phosphotransferase system component IIA